VSTNLSTRRKAAGQSSRCRPISVTSILVLLAGFAFNAAALIHHVFPAAVSTLSTQPNSGSKVLDFALSGPNSGPHIKQILHEQSPQQPQIPSPILCSSGGHRVESLLPGRETPFTLTGSGSPDLVVGLGVVPREFSRLSPKPILGRTLRSGDERMHRSVVVVSERLWRRRFGADPALIGKTITLDAEDYIVIGVMPASFWFPHPSDPVELWVPARSAGDAPEEATS
jgi:MacB-like periplasmic core domain